MTTKHYRYILLIGLTTLLAGLSACQEQENSDSEMNGGRLVIRALLDGEPIATEQTRAYSGDINLVKQGFTVIGYKTPDLFFNADPNFTPAPNIFNAGTTKDPIMEVTATNGKFAIPLIKEQEDGTYLSLFAWASAPGIDASGNAVSAITATAHKKTDTGAPWIDVTLPSPEAKSQPDIVGAHYMNQPNEYVVSAIDFDFKHLLSKITLRARNAIAADVVINKVEIVQQDICTTARFEFDGSDSLGVWKNHTNKSSATLVPEGWQQKQVSALNTATLGEALLIPQQAANEFWTLKVTYATLLPDGSQGSKVTRLVPLKALQLCQGKNYIYTLDLSAEEIELQNVTVEPWKEYAYPGLSMLPMVEGEMDPDVLLLLDGSEPPYETPDGRKFWLDRSGWNHHCQIMDKTQYSGSGAFDITYSASEKGYVINSSASGSLYNHIRIPYLGKVEGDVSFETVCFQKTGRTADPYPFVLTNNIVGYGADATTYVQLAPDIAYWSYQMVWRYGATGSNSPESRSIIVDYFDYYKPAFYYGSRKAKGEVLMGIDDTHSGTSTTTSANEGTKEFAGGYIGPKFKGTFHYLKIYRKALTKTDFMEHYAELQKKFNLPTYYQKYMPPTRKGLIWALDARCGGQPFSLNGYSCFREIAGGNHPVNNNISLDYSSANYYYSCSENRYMQFRDIPPVSDSFTLEIILSAEQCGGSPINFSNSGSLSSSSVSQRVLYLHPKFREDGRIYVDCPGNNRHNMVSWPSGLDNKSVRRWVVRRTAGGQVELLFGNSYPISSTSASGSMPTPNVASIGDPEWKGKIYAIRYYNRALTNTELLNNYTFDASNFNYLVPR